MVDLLVAPFGHRADVGARGERLVVAGDDDDGDRVVGVEPLERVLQLDGERVVERIHALRPVEADDAGAVAGLDDDVLIGHGFAFQLST